MAYVIAEPCIGTKDTACVDDCPVDCIHPKKNTSYDDGRPGFEEVPQLYIDKQDERLNSVIGLPLPRSNTGVRRFATAAQSFSQRESRGRRHTADG